MANSFEVQGKLYEIFDTQNVSDRFSKREFIVEVEDGKYPQHIKFQFTNDKCDLLDSYSAGDEVKVSFNLQGKPFEKNGVTQYFTNLSAWKIERVGSAKPQPKKSTQQVEDDLDDSLPF